ncbi:LuxR C-terminal-related transcriptional regulator [Angustibacter luteus]|uniref:LuxR C-terminal-related transcriptional regulator n=1 Tax=Angustibacter luteus TaxID=658456 RepID=A0ABW1JDN3_9ACTN
MPSGVEGGAIAAHPIFARDLPGNWVPRPRLDELLDEATTRPLTVVVAPAGSGKSAMLRGWAAQQSARKRRVLWLDCRRARPRVASGVVDALARASEAKGRTVVVLDDAHLLAAADLRAVGELLADGDGRVRIVLASRRDLMLPLVRLELAGQVTTIRATHLRFTDREASRLITAHANGAAAADVQIIRDRGQGWAAALVLGARALAAATDPVTAREALSTTEQPVLDYLLGEVFETLDARTRHVLLCTCSNDLVTASEAVVMSADAGAATLIARMAAEGLLVTAARDASGETAWHYHPLLQELLRRRVVSDGPEHELHEAAEARIVQVSGQHGDMATALRHATHLDDAGQLVELLRTHGLGLIANGERELVGMALDAVPDDLGDGDAGLAVLRALERRAAGDLKRATQLAGQALALGVGPQAHPSTAWGVGEPILLCWLARTGLLPATDAIGAARRRLERGAVDGESHGPDAGRAADGARAWLLIELAVVECWAGQLDAAHEHLDAALVVARAQGADLPVIEAMAYASLVDLARGSYSSADRRAREVIARVQETAQQQATFVASAHVVHAWVALNDLDLELSEQHVRLVRREAAGELDVVVDVLVHLIECHLLAHAGQVQEARSYLDSPPPVPGVVPRFLRRWYAELRGWLALLAADVDDAVEAAAELRALGKSADASLVDAVVLDLRGDPSASAAALDELLEACRPGARRQSVGAAAAVHRTWMSLRDGEIEDAEHQLRGLLSRVGPHRRLVLADVGRAPEFVHLLAGEAARDDAHPAAADLLDTLTRLGGGRSIPAQATARAARERPAPPLVVDLTSAAGTTSGMVIDLTSRELDVLRELSLGGSYTDIAATLYITENTVKTHLASLYRKLGATRRAEALRSAREAGMLPG